VIRMMLHKLTIAWMNAHLCRRQRENQPSLSRIYGLEAEHVTKKNAIRFRIATVEEKMNACNHDRRDSILLRESRPENFQNYCTG